MCDGTIQIHCTISVLSLGETEPHSAPEGQKWSDQHFASHCPGLSHCPTPAFPCTQGDSDPPWLRQLMMMLLATGSSAFSAQTALPVLKFAYKNLCVSQNLIVHFPYDVFFFLRSPFLILILSHLQSWVCTWDEIFSNFSRIAKFWGSKKVLHTYHVCKLNDLAKGFQHHIVFPSA